MGLHRVLRRYRKLGVSATADYLRRRLNNRVIALANQVGPVRRTCPCCQWHGMRFLDFAGHGYGAPDYVCPRCGSHPRHRGLFFFLQRQLDALPSASAILHFAPEPALVSVFAARPDFVYVTTDLTMRGVTLKSNVLALPFRDGNFSLIVASHVLEHLRDDAPALSEMSRVLRSDGHAIIMVPTFADWNARETEEFGAPNPLWDDHWRIYGSDLPLRMKRAGLTCNAERFTSFLTPQQFADYGITEDTIFVATKKP